MEASWDRSPCIALGICAPGTDARNWATLLVTRLLIRFIGWWIVDALLTTILGFLDLDPSPLPENVVVLSIGAVSTAFSPFGPFALCRNWARCWLLWQARRTTGDDLNLTPFTAIIATVLGKVRDNELASHGPERAVCRLAIVRGILALARAWAPRSPDSITMFWAFLQLARLLLFITMLPLALLPTKLRRDIDNKFGHFDTITTGLGALARWFPMALTVDWAWCITAGLGDVIAVLCLTAFTATFLWLGNRE